MFNSAVFSVIILQLGIKLAEEHKVQSQLAQGPLGTVNMTLRNSVCYKSLYGNITIVLNSSYCKYNLCFLWRLEVLQSDSRKGKLGLPVVKCQVGVIFFLMSKADGVNCRLQVAGCRSEFHLGVIESRQLFFVFVIFSHLHDGAKK